MPRARKPKAKYTAMGETAKKLEPTRGRSRKCSTAPCKRFDRSARWNVFSAAN